MRKDPDALKNWSVESNLEIAATQRELIDSAFHALRPGGTLVYSTCTLNRDENEDVCLWLKAQYPDAVELLPLNDLFSSAQEAVTPEGFLHVFPQIYDCEGFFVARLRKTQAVAPCPHPNSRSAISRLPLKGRDAAQLVAAAEKVGWSGIRACNSGCVIKRYGCSRQRSHRSSERSVFPESGSARRKCIIKAIAGSMRPSSRLPDTRIPLP